MENLSELITRIETPYNVFCQKILSDNEEIFSLAKGSNAKHQAWDGGYLDHLQEVMNFAVLYYRTLVETERQIPFKLSDALLILFLHDLEKPWKQLRRDEIRLENERGEKDEKAIRKFKKHKINEYETKTGIFLTEDQWSGLENVEGERNYDPFRRVSTELSAFCHVCDYTSARIFWDFPKK